MIIDITNEVLTKIKTTLTGVTILTSYPSTVPIFPCVVIEESSNIINAVTVDSSGETHNDITFEINIFSNAPSKVTEAKLIRNQIDAIMSEFYGMDRDYSGSIPNFMDGDVYRYTLRYSFTISTNKTIYRR